MCSASCAALTGAWVALKQACLYLKTEGLITEEPIRAQVAAVSCGIYQGVPVLDLDYDEDSKADADANFVLTASGGIVEIQGTAEGAPFTEADLQALMGHAREGTAALFAKQRLAVDK